MRGSNPAIATASPATTRGERVTFLLLGLALMAAIIPVGPAIPAADRGSIPATCTAPTARTARGDCASAAQAGFTIRSAELRMALMFLP